MLISRAARWMWPWWGPRRLSSPPVDLRLCLIWTVRVLPCFHPPKRRKRNCPDVAPIKLFGKIDLFTQLMIDLICCNTMCELARLRWNFLAKKEMNGWNKFWSNIFDFFLVFCCIPYWLDGLMGFENLINIFLYFLFFNCELFIVLEFSPFELTNPRFSIIK